MKLGSYEILTALGAGGMGEVYRAKDTKLGREVALKILPATFTNDPDRVARFRREAQVLASLNHPHIAQIHGLDEANGSQFLVLELVDGENLDKRIARGRIPVDEALGIAKQIAEALEAAHERGVIHRDLKPANIALTKDGTVKVLDFGLAKAVETTSGSVDAMNSPTITTPAMMTGVGMILGTAAYMSPEQAKGRPADKRSDVWAFGCVLYEMLAGRRAFDADDVSDTLAAVLRADPDFTAIPNDVPASIRALLQGCLKKDRRERIGDISTALFLLRDPIGGVSTVAPPASRHRWALSVMAPAATAIVFTLIGIATAWNIRRPVPGPITRFSIRLPEGERFASAANVVAISPDGTRIAYSTTGATDTRDVRIMSRLFVRALADMEPRLIASGPGGASPTVAPAFSPDGRWLVVWSGEDRTIRKVLASGGTLLTICKAGDRPASLSWDRNQILFVQAKGVMRVSADGGEPELLAATGPTEAAELPQMIDGGRSLLFTLAKDGPAADRWDKAAIVVQDVKTGRRRVVLASGAGARYVPTGYLVYAVGNTLMAASFDEQSATLRGNPIPVLDGVRRSLVASATLGGIAQIGVSSGGTLVYVPGRPQVDSSDRDLLIGDPSGSAHALPLPRQSYVHPRISPDGKRIIVGTDNASEAAIWVLDDLTGSSRPRRLTFEGRNLYPIWNPNGREVVFQSDRQGDRGLYRQGVDGTQVAERLTTAEPGVSHVPGSWTPDGRTLAYSASNLAAPSTLWTISPDGDRKPKQLVEPQGLWALGPAFSPDGRWIAYSGSAAGISTPNLFLQPFPPTGAKYQLTTTVGANAVWSRDGTQIFFLAGPEARGRVFAIGVRTTPTVTVGQRSFIEFGQPLSQSPNVRHYDISPDGKQFVLVNGGTAADFADSMNLVINWTEDLKQRVPVK
jgi:serine/threonine-protein kinase